MFLATNVEEGGSEGSDYVVKLVDFGIAKIFMEPLTTEPSQNPMGGPTQDGAVIGTPNFMSPEQLTIGGAPGRLTDLWSLGACTFAAMLARIPFEGEVLGDIVLKVCAAPLAEFRRVSIPTCRWDSTLGSRKLAHAIRKSDFRRPKSCPTRSTTCAALRAAAWPTLDDEQVQFALKPATPEALAALEELEEQNRAAMSPKTALLAGLGARRCSDGRGHRIFGVARQAALGSSAATARHVITFVSADGGAINP